MKNNLLLALGIVVMVLTLLVRCETGVDDPMYGPLIKNPITSER